MALLPFKDKDTLKLIREERLIPTIDTVNDLDLKVKGLQKVVALTMTEPDVDIDGKRITFKRGGEDADAIELGPLLDSFKHGVDISDGSGASVTNVEKIKFTNSKVTQNGDEVNVEVKTLVGQVDAETLKGVNLLRVTGNTIGSSLGTDGILTLNMPANSIKAFINGDTFEKVDKIRVLDSTKSSNITGDTLNIKIPDPIKGSIMSGTPVDVTSIDFIGNIGNSRENDGAMVIELPGQEVDPGDGFEVYHKIKLKGNIGESKVVNQILELDLPAGGGGTGASDLKVGIKGHTPISGVGEIWFNDSEIKVDQTTKSNAKVLISHKGAPVSIEDKGGTTKTGNAKLIKLTGDVETSDISDTGQLTINIPHHAGLSVSDGTTTSKGISELAFPGSTVTFDSSKAKAIITADGITGKMNGVEDSIKEIEITGTIGGSTLAGGKLKIDLPAGGGGTGGADITGVVGSDSAKIERIEVIGAKYNSSVTESTKTLKIDIPRKVSIKGGADVFSDIDMVEVANSTVQLDVASGTRKAFITPHIPFMFYGWFQDMTALNNAIPSGGRIPTKTCAYVPDPRTRQNTLWMWLPNAGTGISDWVAMPTTGSLALVENNHSIQGVLGIQNNPMVSVDDKGLMTIADVTVPEIICETLTADGTSAVTKGKFNELRFEDGEGVVSFDPRALDLKVHRAQRRFAMGTNPDGDSPSFTEDKYEGSLWLNETDHSWWGFNNKDVTASEKKWTKVLHRGMSGEVSDLSSRVPQKIVNITDTTPNADNPLWLKSGWTHMYKDNDSLPDGVQHTTGGFIQTFVYHDEDTSLDERTQVLHLDDNAASYKRYFKPSERKWSDWVKLSFTGFDLEVHNKDPHAHAHTNPFYKAWAIGVKFSELEKHAAPNQWVIPNKSYHVLGAGSSGVHRNAGPQMVVPYDGVYHCRGHLYWENVGVKDVIPLDWVVQLERRKVGDHSFATIRKAAYPHHSTSTEYLPMKWDMENITLEKGDELALSVYIRPQPGYSINSFTSKFPDAAISPVRSYVAVDAQGNDMGSGIGETFRNLFGNLIIKPDAGALFGVTSGKPHVTALSVSTDIQSMTNETP